MTKINSKSGMTVIELMVAAGMATGVAIIASRLTSNMHKTIESAASNGLGTTTLNAEILQAIQDPLKWLTFELRADSLGSVSLSDCLSATAGYACPANDTSITDPEIRSHVPLNGAVSSIALFLPKNSSAAPSSLTNLANDFQKIAGLDSSPLYLDGLGNPCTASTSNCLRVLTGYFIRQRTTAGADPGAIKFLVKMAQNTSTTGASQSPGAISTNYLRINVGTAWRGVTSPSGPIPVGTIIPFSGTESSLPTGYLLCNGATTSVLAYPLLAMALNPSGTNNYWTPPGAPQVPVGAGNVPDPGAFYLPDLRGVYLRGIDDRASAFSGVDPARPRTPGSFQTQAILDHVHTAPGSVAMSAAPIAMAPQAMTYHVANISANLGAFGAGAFPGAGGGGFFYAGGPSNGLTAAGGGTASTTTSFAVGPAAPLALTAYTLGGGFNFGGAVGPVSTVGASVGTEVRPPTASVHYMIRADY